MDQLTHVFIADVKKAVDAPEEEALLLNLMQFITAANLAEVAAGIKTNISWLLDAAFWDVY